MTGLLHLWTGNWGQKLFSYFPCFLAVVLKNKLILVQTFSYKGTLGTKPWRLLLLSQANVAALSPEVRAVGKVGRWVHKTQKQALAQDIHSGVQGSHKEAILSLPTSCLHSEYSKPKRKGITHTHAHTSRSTYFCINILIEIYPTNYGVLCKEFLLHCGLLIVCFAVQ